MKQSRLEEINTKIEKLNKKLDKLSDTEYNAYNGYVSDIYTKPFGWLMDSFPVILVGLFPITLTYCLIGLLIEGVEKIVAASCRHKMNKINKKIAKLQTEKELLDLTNVDQKLQDNFKQLDEALKIDKVSDKKIEQLKDICNRLKLELTKLENVANKQSTNKTIAKETSDLTADDDVTK